MLYVLLAALLWCAWLASPGGSEMAPTTEFEDTGGASFTSLANEQTFLETIEAETSAQLAQPGASVLGNPVWRIGIGNPTGGSWLITAAQHGDEPASREAGLQFIRDVAYSADQDVLDYLASRQLVVMPTANPDGIDAGTRNNANGQDLNRDHYRLAQPETRAMHAVRGPLQPHIVTDLHERSVVQAEDIEYRNNSMEAIPGGLINVGDQVLAAVIDALNAAGGITHTFYTGSTARSSWRESSGIAHAVAITLETHDSNAATKRVADALVALSGILGWHLDNDLTGVVDQTRADAMAGLPNPYLLQTGDQPPWPVVLLPENLTGYDLGGSTIPQPVRDSYGVVVSGDMVSMSQVARPVIPIILDEESDDELVTTTRLVTADEQAGSGLPQVATATIRNRLTWLSCNLSDGAVITELPDLQGDEVSRVIGEYTSANLSLPIPAVGGRDLTLAQRAQLAIQSTQPPRTKIVAVVNDVPAWEGIPLPRDLGTDAGIPLGCVSMEGYLRHVYITDHTFNEQDVALIADGILRDAVTTPHGPGVALVIDAPNIGTIASRSYLDIDNQTVYAGLQELMKAGLMEWTLSPDWRAGFAYRIVDTIARVRGQLGKSEPTAVFQSATFSSQGASDARYALKEDYGDDRYANVVRLHGAGQGEDQPRSAPAINQAALDAGIPVWELRDSAPQTVTQQALLDLHAERRLDRVRDGAHALEITARWDAPGARLGVDWGLGDLVRHELVGHAHPDGLDGVKRAIGFALSIQRGTIRPILQDEEA